MKRADLDEFEIEEDNFKLRISRDNGKRYTAVPSYGAAPAPLLPHDKAAPEALPVPDAKDLASTFIKSPIVGTFYRASAPENPSYVEEGTRVKPDSIVCIVEAMKVMNEIQAETQGTVIECLVQNGETVEYGQPLFKIKKD
jgi:acetyl-CoA carboxylase biotin carboxyl carrier protein